MFCTSVEKSSSPSSSSSSSNHFNLYYYLRVNADENHNLQSCQKAVIVLSAHKLTDNGTNEALQPSASSICAHVNSWLDSEAKRKLRSGFFWNYIQRRFVACYRRFGTTNGSHHSWVNSPEDETDGLYQNVSNQLLISIEYSNYRLSRNVGDYQFTLRAVLEEPRSHVHRGGRLKSRKEKRFSHKEINC